MKTKIYFGIMAIVMGLSLASCEEDFDEYTLHTTPVLTESSVVTGSSDVTATSATLHGSVDGLENMASSAYVVGFNYGFTQDNLSESVSSSLADGAFTATIGGLTNNSNLYYQAFVRLQGKVTYTGEVKSLVTTNAKVVTADAASIDYASAVLGGKITDAPADATCGIVISTSADVEAVRAGLIVANKTLTSDLSITRSGLLPNTTYHYAAYLNLGTGVVYGDVKTFTTAAYEFDLDNDLVDLGLSVKWARFNVGAKSEADLGGLFGFGDLTGCNNSIDPVDYASADIYKTANDITNKVYGGKVTLPTAADYEELFSLCTSEWTEMEGVAGYKLTGPNGNSIFLPAAGSRTINDVTGEGTEGYYMTGTINPSNNQFAVSYQFANSFNTKTTTAVYQALSVRAVSTAKNVPFNKELLFNTWEIDLTSDGSYQVFPGPTYFYGMDDSWATVTNGEPVIGDVWNWAADFAGNSWAVGGSADNCRGYMTFSKGKEGEPDTVFVSQVTPEGTFVENKGTFTVDEKNKTITLDVDILAPTNYTTGFVDNKKTDIKILSLTKSSMQLAVVRTDPSQGPCLLSINYIPQLEKYGYTAKLTCYGGNDDTTPDAWASATMTIPGGEAGLGTYTLTFNAQAPRVRGQVYILDIEGYAAAYPNSLVRIDAIKADGKEVKFDASKFYYGNLEGNGNYRIEMANIWGCGRNDSWNGLKDTPFQPGGGETTDETALAFENTFEVTFTVASITSNGAGVYTPNLVAVEGTWNETWGYNEGATFEVIYENNQYRLGTNTSFDIKYESSKHAGGLVMSFIEVADIYGFFPAMHATLDALYLDDKEVEFDVTKVIDFQESPKYRLELWNPWGATAGNCAFGTPDENNIIKELGFSSSMQVKFTFHSLFAVPQW